MNPLNDRYRLHRKLVLFSLFFLFNLTIQAQTILLNVKHFGAKGDGKTDDVRAIQSAVNAAKGKSGATIFFPKGKYLIASFTKTANYLENYSILLHDNLIIAGQGNLSIIQLADHLFDQKDSAANAHIFLGKYLKNVVFRNLQIEMNGAKNLTPKSFIKNNCAVFIDHGRDIVFSRINVKNCAGRNMLIIKGNGANVKVSNCKFQNGGYYVGNGVANPFQADFSFVYSEWDSTLVDQNLIEQQNIDIALKHYTGGIELHGSYSVARNNLVVGCYPAIYLSSSWKKMEQTQVINNQMLHCLKGVSFWVNFPINQISITKNKIVLTHTRLIRPQILTGIDVPNGNSSIYNFAQANNAALTNISISDNNISVASPNLVHDKTAGILLHSIHNSSIINNTILNMNYGGIIFQGSKWGMANVKIEKNTFSNFQPNEDEQAVAGFVVITDTYSSKVENALGWKEILFSKNNFLLAKNTIATSKATGQFLDAFIALPDKYLREIIFSNNYFSNPKKDIRFIKTN